MPKSLLRLIVVLLALIALALVWRYLAERGLVSASRLVALIESSAGFRESPWMLPALVGVYVVSLLLMFPLTILVVLTGLLFGPWWGLLYATLGTLSSSAVTFWVGHMLGRQVLERHGGQSIQALSRYMGDRGIRSMVVINLLPLAPFTMTNLIAGAFHLTFGRYMIGSALGIIPGLAVVTVLGGQISAVLTAEAHREVWLGLGASALLVLLVFGLFRWWASQRGGG